MRSRIATHWGCILLVGWLSGTIQCAAVAAKDQVDCGCTISAAGGANPCLASHKPVFYDNDFSYLNQPDYTGHCLGDSMKQLLVGDSGRWGKIDFGGQLRERFHHERGMGQVAGATRFEPTETDFLLNRLRLYSDWRISDRLRFYTEGVYADVAAEDQYIPRDIDRNFGDILNAFVDVQVSDHLAVRVGRQELLYGAQRLVSPLDWSNVRRRFDGVKFMATAGDWSVDAFYTQFVPVDPHDFDQADSDQPFYGYYATYGGFEHFSVETYYLGYDNQNPGAATADFSLHTWGIRLNGGIDDWLFEFEGGPQFGRQSGLDTDHEAAFATIGLGRNLGDPLPWSPTVWCYYDYASGNAGGGDFNRFNHLFPLGHRYLGFIDAVQRANVEAPNILLTLKPTKRLTLLCWYYHFMANQSEDIVPSIGGTPPQSTSSKDLGDELDLLATYQFTPRSNILFGWSHFWRGNKIIAPEDADFFYTQLEVNF